MIRLGAVGDVVRTLPAASALRSAYPSAHLSWLVEPASSSLLEAQPWIDEVFVYPRSTLVGHLRRGRVFEFARELRAFLRSLRSARFDLAVDFHGILKSGVLSWLARARTRVGYARPYGREFTWLFANQRAKLGPRGASRFERNLALVRFLGLDPEPMPEPLSFGEKNGTYTDFELQDGGAPVVLHPGTSDATPYKRYTVSGYSAVARALARDPGVTVIVTSGPARDDHELAQAIVAGASGAARLAPPTPSLVDLAALFARCRLYIGSDTGPLHVASLVGTPVVQLLGPTDPGENAPYSGTASRILRVPVACSPCRRGCAAATCMRAISPQQVTDAARALLAGETRRC